ncbi:hypothetical protein D3C72_2104980 [compost metagenome]
MKKMKLRKKAMKSSWLMVHRAVAMMLIASMNSPRTAGVTRRRAKGSITVTVDMKAP